MHFLGLHPPSLLWETELYFNKLKQHYIKPYYFFGFLKREGAECLMKTNNNNN